MRRITFFKKQLPEIIIGFDLDKRAKARARIQEDSYAPVDRARELKVRALHDALVAHYKFSRAKHKMAMREYSTNKFCHPINRALRTDGYIIQAHQQILGHLNEALAMHTTPKGGLITYTGIKFNPHDSDHERDGDGRIIAHQKPYVSSSINPSVAHGFSHDIDGISHVLKVHIPEGAHGAYIAHHSDLPSEREFLIHRGAKFLITPSPREFHDYAGDRIHQWHARLIHDGVKELGHT
jgi:hypothetical protein